MSHARVILPRRSRHAGWLLPACVVTLAAAGALWGWKYSKAKTFALTAQAEDLRDAVAAARPRTELEKLFDRGVDAYARRDFGGARMAFAGVLHADPGNAEAKNALRRAARELP